MEKLLVTIGGVLLIGFIVWWFFGKRSTSAAEAAMTDKAQEVEVIVDGGYTPNTVVLRQGVPATIVFIRKDPSGCFSHVVFPDFGVNEVLPVGEKHPIAIDTTTPGEYQYACGMNMFHGKVVIRS